MVVVALGLLAAVGYGVSDFIGGVASRHSSAWPVAFLTSVVGTLTAVAIALSLPGDPSGTHLLWGALGGIGNGMGGAFLYRGLAGGRMAVVGPVSAVCATLLPVAAGVLGGERPTTLVWLGIALALPGIWLVAREYADPESPGPVPQRSGLLDGVLAGCGFGLMFAALGQVPASGGYWPMALNQLVSAGIVAVIAVLFGGSVRIRHRSQWWGVVSGMLAGLAVLGFLLATHRGLLSVSAVLTSLYPAVTVLLAALVLHERVHRGQGLGLALCAVTVVTVALG